MRGYLGGGAPAFEGGAEPGVGGEAQAQVVLEPGVLAELKGRRGTGRAGRRVRSAGGGAEIRRCFGEGGRAAASNGGECREEREDGEPVSIFLHEEAPTSVGSKRVRKDAPS